MSGPNKVWSLGDLAHELESRRKEGRRVVHCHGVFDLLHIGHVRHFEQAKKAGDLLVVTLTPDEFVHYAHSSAKALVDSLDACKASCGT